MAELKAQLGDDKVILGLSGGVDSSVAVLMFLHMFFLLLEFVLDFPEQIAYNLSVTEHFVLYLL